MHPAALSELVAALETEVARLQGRLASEAPVPVAAVRASPLYQQAAAQQAAAEAKAAAAEAAAAAAAQEGKLCRRRRQQQQHGRPP